MKLIRAAFVFGFLGVITLQAQQPGTVLWTFTAGDHIESSPAIGRDGAIYFGSWDHKVYALKPDGQKKWDYLTDGGVPSSPALADDGTIYIGSMDSKLYAFTPDGAIKWTFSTNGEIRSSPAIAGNGIIYISSHDDYLYAIQPGGQLEWKLKTYHAWNGNGCPAIAEDGTIYIHTESAGLWAIAPTGIVKWKLPINATPSSAIALDDEGTIYVGSAQGRLYAIQPCGLLKWTFQVDDGMLTSPTIGYNGIIYCTTGNYYNGSHVYALNHNGTLRWGFESLNGFSSPVTVADDSTLYVNTNYDNNLYALYPNGKIRWSVPTGYGTLSAPTLNQNGVLYVGTSDHKLLAITTTSKGLANTPWPKFGRGIDNHHSIYDPLCPVAGITAQEMFWQPSRPLLLDGSLSYDPDNDDLVFEWHCIEKPTGAVITWGDSTRATTAVQTSPDALGVFRFALIVRDSHDGSSATAVTVRHGMWTFSDGTEIEGYPAVAQDGTIYIGTHNSMLYAFKRSGEIKWQFATAGQINYAPSVGYNGVVYVGASTPQGLLYAINADGTLRWEYQPGSTPSTPPTIGPDGTIYIGGWDQTLQAITPSGQLQWSINTDGYYPQSPTIGPDGTLYATTSKGSLYAVNRQNGAIKWHFKALDHICSQAVADVHGKIFLCSLDQYLYALNLDGSVAWKFMGDGLASSFALDDDGTIYTGGYGHSLYAITSTGTLKWKFDTEDAILATPTLAADGTIWFGCQNGAIYVLNQQGEMIWQYNLDGSIYDNSACMDSNYIYITTQKGNLYSYYRNETVLKSRQWSKLGGDNQNSSNGYSADCPVLKIAADTLSLAFGSPVLLDASQSHDPDGDTLAFAWCCINQPSTSRVQFVDSTQACAEVHLDQIGTYRFQVLLTDHQDGATMAECTVQYGLKWVYIGTGAISNCPLIGPDNTIYAAFDKELVALNSKGWEEWSFLPGETNFSAPALGQDLGLIIAGEKNIYSIASDGHEKWRTNFPFPIWSAPALAPNGKIYIETGHGELYSLQADGSVNWCKSQMLNLRSLSVGPDSCVYALSDSNKILAVQDNGAIKWSFKPREHIASGPAIDSLGNLYFSASSGPLFSLTPDGQFRRYYAMTKNDFAPGSQPSPVLDQKNNVYYASSNGKLYAFNSDSSLRWIFNLDQQAAFLTSPTIGEDSTLYIGSSDHHLYAIDSKGQLKWKFHAPCEASSLPSFSPPAIDDAGIVYFGAGQNLYALYSDSKGLMKSAWPKYGKNKHNTFSEFGYQPNIPVAVVAAESLFAVPGETVILDASGSYDPDLDPLTFHWRCNKNTTGATIILLDSLSSRISVNIPDLIGDYRFSVMVNDHSDGAAVKIVNVRVGLKWIFRVQNAICGSPALSDDGDIYFAANDHCLYALAPDGQLKWKKDVSFEGWFSPAVENDGDILLYSTKANALQAVSPKGELLWKTALYNFHNNSTPAVDKHGNIYLVLLNSLISIDDFGNNQWTKYLDYSTEYNSTVIDQDGNIVQATPGLLYLLDNRGNTIWTLPNTSGIISTPAIDCDGTIYCGLNDGMLLAATANGAIKWNNPIGGSLFANPVIGLDGTIYVGSYDQKLYAVDPQDGSVKWSFATTGKIWGSPVVDQNGTLYFGTEGEIFYAIKMDGSLKWSLPVTGKIIGSPNMASDGTIYIGTDAGFFYAIQPGHAGLAKSNWPKFRQNWRNTACLQPPLVKVETAASVDMPTQVILMPNRPNPFNSSTTIYFALPRAEKVQIRICDITGRTVATLVSEKVPSGSHHVQWNASNHSSGLYFIELIVESMRITQKCLYIK